MKFRWFVIAAVCLYSSIASAGGRGGHNVTFDPNSYGGGWACFRSLASGTCGGATTQYFDAACDGTTSDVTAAIAFTAWAVTQNPSRIKLYIPPGSSCIFDGSSSYLTNGVQNIIVWAYGATFNLLQIGASHAFYENNTHSARIISANAGDQTVTLVTAADASIFSVGDWVIVDGYELQDVNGFPPNWQFFEYKLITAITGTTTKIVTLNSPLENTYLSTWPLISAGSPIKADIAGPASIHLMGPTWKTNVTWFGGRVTVLSQWGIIGQNITVYGMYSDFGFAVSICQICWVMFSELGAKGGNEIDKLISFLGIYRSTARQLAFQSASVDRVLLDSVTAGRNFAFGLNGTANNTEIKNSIISSATPGPIGYGHGTSIIVDGSIISAVNQPNHRIKTSLLSFSNGTFFIAKNDAQVYLTYNVFVPGQKYHFGDTDGTYNPNPTTNTIFTVTAVREDATNFYFDTTLPNTLPTPSCGSNPTCDGYVAYPAATITQKFSGPANLTQFAAPP